MRSGRGNRVAGVIQRSLHALGWEAVYCISQALSIVKVVYNVGDGVPNPHMSAGKAEVSRPRVADPLG